jgi:hypothetical protein
LPVAGIRRGTILIPSSSGGGVIVPAHRASLTEASANSASASSKKMPGRFYNERQEQKRNHGAKGKRRHQLTRLVVLLHSRHFVPSWGRDLAFLRSSELTPIQPLAIERCLGEGGARISVERASADAKLYHDAQRHQAHRYSPLESADACLTFDDVSRRPAAHAAFDQGE